MKAEGKQTKQAVVYFELYAFCQNESIDAASELMETTIRLLQPSFPLVSVHV